jgi:hypothetical protein
LGRWLGGRRQRRRELARGEGVEGAEAGGEFDVGEAAFAVEPAEKIASRAIAFLGVALETAGDKVAVGIASQEDARRHGRYSGPQA